MSVAHVLDEAQLAALSTRTSAQRAAALLAIDHLPAVPVPQRAALLQEARGWLADCGWQAEADDIPDVLVRDLVDRRYEGGWPGFVVANVDLLDPAGS
ncbi:hypothetical protein [Pseudokineococcus marinus]|uniref:Uncharacterized protein n=1 Tax=Pseudokineococcus marinus TaxID=351215 RepID=A0A849BF72_9ACTN|nr:hypothetical protein [Pseudokineococcus marinus]NNH21710.1 hypothetical protein [Pseudokineococcus marinus]